MMICISGLNWARRHKRQFDAVLSIENPNTHWTGLRFHRWPRPAHLILRFYDLDYPIPAPYHRPWMCLATHDDIITALKFATNHSNLLIHCRAGVSRSTAIALAILMARLRDADRALATVVQLRPIAVPNRHIVKLSDEVLGCDGKLLAVMDAWDQATQGNATRRHLCRQAHYYEFGIPLWRGI